MKIYLASPLGFAESTRAFMAELVAQLTPIVEVINPWDDVRFLDDIKRAPAIVDPAERRALLATINRGLASKNAADIREADGMVAVLDGIDVDSGTAAEIGYAYGLGKRIYGLRTDFRLTGENEVAVVNLQVRYFIDDSGGTLVATVADLLPLLREWPSGS
ncbi:MAG: nucleoside 2-deoxyribosyltransferase [Thermomicrobiales bacterium]|nr:nucleoside 2-deoxyribosyltransferase [Thermomicrobiales bacterium]